MAHAIPLPARGRVPGVAWPVAAGAATLAVGVPVESAAYPGDAGAAAADLAVAVAFVAGGAAVGARSALTALLMAATGVAWLAGTAVDDLALLHRGPLVQLLVCAPGGRPRTWIEWLAVAAGWASAVVPEVGRDDAATLALGVLVSGVALGRWAGGAVRRARAVPAAAAVAFGLVLAAGALAGESGAETVLWAYEAVLVAVAVVLCVDLRAGGWRDAALTSLVIELGDVTRRGSLTDALSQAVGDPSLVVAYRRDGRWVDERGRDVSLPKGAPDRATTRVEAAGEGAAAVLLHDPSALSAPGLREQVSASVRLALENLRLRDDVAASVHEVEASRARLLQARDVERRSLETRLRAGVDLHLDAAARALAELGAEEAAELDRVRSDLRRFAGGLHPVGLESGGLAAALPPLAAAAPLPVDVTVECGRLPAQIDAAAWFVCSEGLANVAKHAEATGVAIRVTSEAGRVTVEVEDDGRGGADLSAGRGLRGLAARVDAVGGRLEVADRPDGGTRLKATLPVEDAR